ncbi:Uncharacterized protein HZ326_13208 [Fusarium oxysporum f. sp. albedinis]|nr:Uncharacterized protein HZ326_13208 [Fusarium oxysporum f. sp. albedinis]
MLQMELQHEPAHRIQCRASHAIGSLGGLLPEHPSNHHNHHQQSTANSSKETLKIVQNQFSSAQPKQASSILTVSAYQRGEGKNMIFLPFDKSYALFRLLSSPPSTDASLW